MSDLATDQLISPSKPNADALLERFERDNKAFEKDAAKVYEQIKENRAWVKGRPGSAKVAFTEDMVEDMVGESQQVVTNLIFSTIQGLVPHYIAKNPDVSAKPVRKVVKIDGDETEETQYEENKLVGESIEIVTQHMMGKAKLKRKAKKCVRSALVSRLGVVKLGYQMIDRSEEPALKSRVQTIQDDMQRLQVWLDDIDESESTETEIEEKKRKFDELERALQETVAEQAQIVEQGLMIDCVPIENLRWDSSVDSDEMYDGGWMAQFTAIHIDDVKAMLGMPNDADAMDKEQQERFKRWVKVSSNANTKSLDYQSDAATDDHQEKQFVRVWERWDKATNSRYQWVDGDSEFLSEPKTVKRYFGLFYPYFVLGLHWLDGEVWPTSVVEVITPLQKEYDDLRKQAKEHREAALPFTLYDTMLVDGEELKPKITKAGVRDIIGVNANGANLNQVFFPGPSVPLNPQLYDTSQIQFDLQLLSGLQDADRGAITEAKTATEAGILESGRATRTNEAVDEIEDWLSMIYIYGAGLCLKNTTLEKVAEIAGTEAVWPENDEKLKEIMDGFVIKIRAGSSGRPDRKAEIDTWFGNLEQLTGMIDRVENYRQLGRADQDNPFYRMIEKTLKVLDQTEDVQTILPKQKESLIDQMIAELQQMAQQYGIDPNELMQLPSIAEYVQRKQQTFAQV